MLQRIFHHRDEPAADVEPSAEPATTWPRRRLRPAVEMLDALHRQRMIADRTGRGFAWIVFGCGRPGEGEMRDLAWQLVRRVRATDEVGVAPAEVVAAEKARRWRRGRECGRRLIVVLPETRAEGAARFLETVRARCPAASAITADVHLYDGTHAQMAGRVSTEHTPADAPAARDTVRAFARPLPWWKRVVDVAAAAAGLAALSPLLGIIGLAIRLDSRGPAIFWQRRAGRGGRSFHIAKFRTMAADAEAKQLALKARSEQDGPAFKLRRDPRVTRVGLFLRSTSLDELPQLWNVLRGDMTLVGPRPLPVAEADGCKPWQKRRLDVTPGLTCIWQVHGRSRVSFDDWMRMDLDYVAKHHSAFGPLHDATLLLKTLPAVFLKRGF